MTIHPRHRRQKHHNLLMLGLGLLFALTLSCIPQFQHFLLKLGNFGYLSAILAGAMFVCTFTVATGALIILTLAKTLSPLELILFGMIGAVIFDFFVFKSVKKSIDKEIAEVFSNSHLNHFKKLLHTKYFAWMMPLIGLLVFISPLPDEFGISLLGLSKLKTYQFLFISILNHGLGMFLIVSAIRLF